MKRTLLFATLLLLGCSNPFEPQITCGWTTVRLPEPRIRVEGVSGVHLVEARVRVCPTTEGPAVLVPGPDPRIVIELQILPGRLRELD